MDSLVEQGDVDEMKHSNDTRNLLFEFGVCDARICAHATTTEIRCCENSVLFFQSMNIEGNVSTRNQNAINIFVWFN